MQAEGLDRVTMRRLAGDWHERLIRVLFSYTHILFDQPGLAQSALVTRPNGPAYLSLAEGILALLSAGGVAPSRAAWAVDLLLHFATSTAAEQGTRQRAIDADDEEDALVAALRDAPADTFPHIAALGPELMSGEGPDRLRWGFSVLINGIVATSRPAEAGSASGSLSAVQQLAAAIGAAVVTTVYFSQQAPA